MLCHSCRFRQQNCICPSAFEARSQGGPGLTAPSLAAGSNPGFMRGKLLQVIGFAVVAAMAGLFLLFATDEARALFETLRNSLS